MVAMNITKNNYPRYGVLKAFRAEVNYTSTVPCIQNLMLAARALGIGTCFTTAMNIVEEDAKILLGMPEETQIIALIPMGYPTDEFKPLKRILPRSSRTGTDGRGTERLTSGSGIRERGGPEPVCRHGSGGRRSQHDIQDA